MLSDCRLTTYDNPYDPFTQFDHWLDFDCEKGYNSCEYLARIAHVSDAMTDEETDQEIERAIDEIIRLDFLGIYKKVRRNESKASVNSSQS